MEQETPTAEQLAIQAYVYGFPIVFNLDQVRRYVTTGIGANPAAPFNSFSHARTLAGPADKFVTINNDTVYSMAQIDLSVGPVLLSVPDTGGLYYVLQFVSAWTDNFAYVGKRATGTAAGQFLLVPPGWEGEIDANVQKIEFPTTVGSIVGRWAVEDPNDLSKVHALQDATTLEPLDQGASGAGLPTIELPEDAGEELVFWEKYRLYSRAFAPADRDAMVQASFAPLGLTSEKSVIDQPAEIQEILKTSYPKAAALLENMLRKSEVPVIDGWQYTFHVFDYNLDFFEVGTDDSDAWKIANPEVRIAHRAGAALGGLWGNHGYEAAYLASYVDSHGDQLSGEHNYTLRLSPPPPAGAFWSVTMYDIPNYYLVENPIDRYSIGNRTPGIVTDADGSVTITMSHTEPADPKNRANWLPTPAGMFRPLIRVYIPGEELLNGTYTVPPIVKVQ